MFKMTFLLTITFMISEIKIVTSKNLIFDIKMNIVTGGTSVVDFKNRHFN